jgi:hypothetical protein
MYGLFKHTLVNGLSSSVVRNIRAAGFLAASDMVGGFTIGATISS